MYFRRRALSDLQLPPSQQLNVKEIRRWKHYFYGTTYLAAIFGILREYPAGLNEQRQFNRLAALACFFDDLADTFRSRSGESWQDNPEQYGQAADASGVALHLLQSIYQALPPDDLAEFKQFLHRVFNLETAGRQRTGQAVPAEELQRLTAEKGGYSVLLFRRLLQHRLSAPEQRALFEFGALIQLCDDIFDLWFDRQSGITTLATVLTEQNDLMQLRNRFERQVADTTCAFRQTPYPRRRVETALQTIHFLVSITRVCLDHYLHLQKKHGTLPLDDRGAMVVDMERWNNRLRAALKSLFERS